MNIKESKCKIKKIVIYILFVSIWVSFVFLFLSISKIKKILLFTCLLILFPIFWSNKSNRLKKYIYYILMIITILVYPIISVIHLYSYNSSTNFGFKKESMFPVLGNLSTKSLFDPNVIMGQDGTYRMYVSYRKEGAIAVTTSKDGKNWEKLKIALFGNPENEWEKTVNRCSVIYKDNKYIMFYTGQFNDESKIGIAESEDGYEFKRIQSNPVIIPDNDYEKKSVMNPYVFFDTDEQIYKMWYAAGETYEPDVIAYATSIDGINWKKYENNPILKNGEENSLDDFKVGACEVYKLKNKEYLMFYIGYTDINTARILYATSEDGINWDRENKKAVIESSKFGFDGNATYKPTAIYDEKKEKWLIWYNGRLVHREYIGFATCKIKDFWK